MMCVNKCSGDSINILLLANKDLHGQRMEESAESENEEDTNTVVTGENEDFNGDLDIDTLSDD